MVIIFIGVASSFLVLPPNRVIRSDGTIVKLEAVSKPHEEVVGMMRLLKDWRMLALLPMFFASNYFYAYQGSVNATVFDGPTRALRGHKLRQDKRKRKSWGLWVLGWID